MSDNISRQAALAYPLSWEHYDVEHGDRKFICGVESYREYIEHLPSVDEWIPCSERLPEEGLPVVITAQEADGRFVDISIRSDVNYWSGFGRINVLAWMPIPEPYKERRKNG